MTMIPWRKENAVSKFIDPFESMQKQMDEYFDSFWNRPLPALKSLNEWDVKETGFVPKVNMRQGDNALTVTAELPGMEEKDIEVLLDSDRLTIKGEKRFKREGDDKDRHYVESTYGSFQRTLPLPYEVERSSIKASFQNGMLKIDAKKAELAKTSIHKVPIG